MSTLALIPAKGTSKGLPGKNIALLGDHPVIAYSIAAALQSREVDRVIVSTDSVEIQRIAAHYGAEVPFLRPPELAMDDTRDIEVFEHAFAWLLEEGGSVPDILVQLRPTSPLRAPTLVDEAVRLLKSKPAMDSVRSVCRPSENPFKMWRSAADGSLVPLLTVPGVAEPYNSPRQILPEAFWQTGAIDVLWSRTLTEKTSLTGEHVLPLLMARADVVDIDSKADLERAEQMLAQGDWVCPR